MEINNKGHSIFARRYIFKGDTLCEYSGQLLTYREFQEKHRIYNKTNRGSFILEFKFNEKHWAIDATEESNCVGRLINHSKRFANVKPVVGPKNGAPFVFLKQCVILIKMMRYCTTTVITVSLLNLHFHG